MSECVFPEHGEIKLFFISPRFVIKYFFWILAGIFSSLSSAIFEANAVVPDYAP